MRVLHEVAYGQNYVSTAHDRRQVVESFVNEVLTRNAAQAIQGLGPLLYKPCKDMWVYTVPNATKRNERTDVYTETFRLKATNDLIKKLNLEITQLKDENDGHKRAQGGRGQNWSGGNGGGYNGNGGKSNKRGGGERGRGGPNNNAWGDDDKFLAQRNLVFM